MVWMLKGQFCNHMHGSEDKVIRKGFVSRLHRRIAGEYHVAYLARVTAGQKEGFYYGPYWRQLTLVKK